MASHNYDDWKTRSPYEGELREVLPVDCVRRRATWTIEELRACPCVVCKAARATAAKFREG